MCVCVCVCVCITYCLESQIMVYAARHRVRILSRIRRVLGSASSFDEQEHKEGRKQTRWTKFTYVARQTTFITKLIENFNLKVSIKTKNTVGKLLTQNKFNKCGLYQLTCHDCNRK
jgi:hypothetical protein